MSASRSIFLLAAVLLIISPCLISAASCGFNNMDFSSLMNDMTGSDSGTTYSYVVHPCGAITGTASCIATTSSSSACQIQVNPKGASFDIGNWGGTANWMLIDPNNPAIGVMYQLTGAQSCWATGTPTSYFANILFVCAATQAATVAVTNPPSSCVQNYTISTPLACSNPGGGGGGGGGGGSSKMSGGWVFIIFLCVLIPVYVAGGCLYKSQKLGAQGMDKCPNVEFWRDLPALCKDGCVFTVNKIKGLCGGGGGGGKAAGAYETM